MEFTERTQEAFLFKRNAAVRTASARICVGAIVCKNMAILSFSRVSKHAV